MPDLEFLPVEPRHRMALRWFAERAGLEIGWPKPLDDLYLMNKPKGIHKPRGFRHALSIRQSLNGPYADSLKVDSDGSWLLDYAYEGSSPDAPMNQALRLCMTDHVPVGVVIQAKPKPAPRYLVLGLGEVFAEQTKQRTFRLRPWQVQTREALVIQEVAEPIADFDATIDSDTRRKALREVVARQGQAAFRAALLLAYRGRCAVTGCATPAVLQAAHIIPFFGKHTNHVQNGLLLRADIHTLFDLGLLQIEPEGYRIRLAKSLTGSHYSKYNGKRLLAPEDDALRPAVDALNRRKALIPLTEDES